MSVADTIRELGYPSRNMLRQWYQEYTEAGELHKLHSRNILWKDKERAISYYVQHGRNMARTIKAIGYPHRETMRKWVHELAPNERKVYSKHSSVVKYTSEQKKEAVIEFSSGDSSVVSVAKALKVSRNSLYKWEKELLGERCTGKMKHESKPPLPDDRDTLLAEVKSLKKQVYHLQMERAILEKAAEIIKKTRASTQESWQMQKRPG